MRPLLVVAFLAACIGILNAQVLQQNIGPTVQQAMAPLGITSFVAEGFEVERFPPAGWTLEFTGHQYWGRYAGASGYGVGTASAAFRFFDAPANTAQSLVLSAMGPSLPGDSLRFDHAYASYSGEIDRLMIETSTNGGTTYSTLATLNGGTSGSLVTAAPTATEFVPLVEEWKTKRYALPVGTNKIRFKAISAYGNNLYIDNCTVGTSVAVDVGAQSIDIPNPTLTLPQIPKVTVQNHGTTTQTFTVTLSISPGGYISTRTVTALASNATSQVSFDGWTPTAGSCNVTAFTSLAGDLDKTNDTIRAAIVANQSQPVTNINAFFRDGQVFVTWTNLGTTNVAYTLYRAINPIHYGHDLSSAQNLGNVRDNSGLNQRLTDIAGGTPVYLKIDSASSPLTSDKGLFVATSTTAGSFYYAITPTVGGLEDTTIVVGSNSLASPVSETIMMPKPVWQESRIVSGKTFDIYVQFATKVTSSIYPQMTNAGTLPFNFGLVKSGTVLPHPVTFWMHPSDGNFLPNSAYLRTIGDSNEWVVTIDDYIPTIDQITAYYGFHEDYDMHFDQNQVPTSGTIYNYTSARVAHTVNWAIRNLPVDSTRTYMTGWSLGAIGALFNSVMIRERIAAIFIYCPRVDMSQWGVLLGLWGTYETNLLTNEGYRRNERLNASFLVSTNRLNALPLMFTFCGKNDAIGWQEKIVFYDSLSANKHGGFHFWSMTDHPQTYYNSPWQPSFPNFSFFTRYRTNLSYPAFTNCSINDNPGNGNPSNGASIGSINGHLDWNDDIVDTTNRWEITLKMKDLSTIYGSDPAPDSATTDVTLRRLQVFTIPTDSKVHWVNEKNGTLLQEGNFTYDGGLITIPSVKVFKASSRLKVDIITGGATIRRVPSQYGTIQTAINASIDGDTVLVAEGTYKENIVLMKKITVGSAFVLDNDTTHISRTIIDGSQPRHPDSMAVVTIDGSTDTTTILCGFTITGGKGNRRTVNYPGVPVYQIRLGAGVDIAGGGARIHHNIVRANNCNAPTEAMGGVVNIFDAADKNGVSYAIIEHNTIADNTLVGYDGEGGAFAIGHSSAIRDNLIARNTVRGTSLPGYGGAFEIWNGIVNIEANRIINNSASHGGGALYLYSVQAAGVVPHVALVNNIVMSNAAGTNGGGICVTESDVVVAMVNNTFYSNTAASGGSGASIQNGATIRALNTILWDTTGGEIDTSSGGVLVASYCDIHGGFPGAGNIDADPLFFSSDQDSLAWFHGSSPCANSGVSTATVGGAVYTAPARDCYSHFRPFNGAVDIGAFEDGPWSGVGDTEGIMPTEYVLHQNFPNPFNPTTIVSYQLPAVSDVKLVVYDLLGREVAILVNERKSPGSYEVKFDANGLATGVYLYRLTAGDFTQTKRLMLIR